MYHENKTIKLVRSQWSPVFIPVSSSIRCFKQVYGSTWSEIDRVDITDSSTTDAFTYDEQINVLLFHPSFVGNFVQIDYDHYGIPNPGTLDLVPFIISEQCRFNNNRIVSGLYVVREYSEGMTTGWNGRSINLAPGIVHLAGSTFSIGGSYWDLNKLGGQAGGNIVTAAVFYLDYSRLSDTQLRTHMIESPQLMLSSRYNLDDGGGISSALLDLRQQVGNVGDGFVEVLKCIVIGRPYGLPPTLVLRYEPMFRVVPIY